MSGDTTTYLVTGASGGLGRLVVEALLEDVAPDRIGAFVRDPAAVRDLAARGVRIHAGTYEDRASLDAALEGVDRVLLVSSSAMGDARVGQHRNVIDAAAGAGVSLLAYTSILHCGRTPLKLAADHVATEALLAASGLPSALLRNGWYFENEMRTLRAILANRTLVAASGDGRLSSASREDYARAAATVLRTPGATAAGVYELAGDRSFSKPEFAAELARQLGEPIAFRGVSEPELRSILTGGGMPFGFAALMADTDAGIAEGALFDDSHTLSRLIRRPTSTLEAAITAGLAALNEKP